MRKYKNISLLGSTGSIGQSTLEVLRCSSNSNLKIKALTCNSNIDLIIEQAIEFKPELLVISDDNYTELKNMIEDLNLDIRVSSGIEGLIEAATLENVDVVVTAIVGQIGLLPTIKAIQNGKDICLANKETLVVGGDIVMKEAELNNVSIVPVDSEHSAIFQLLEGNSIKEIKKLIITASGGPFRNLPVEKLEAVTVKEALNHPNWSMGSKITIDSASLMNKGLEVIEAVHLFSLPVDKIEVVVHPQSIIHSMIEFVDSSIFAQLGPPDMKLPIHYALNYPHRKSQSHMKQFSITDFPVLNFEAPRRKDFPCLNLAYEAIKTGGTMPCVLNSANEAVVEAFLQDKISFTDIPKIIEEAMSSHKLIKNPDLETLLACHNIVFNETVKRTGLE